MNDSSQFQVKAVKGTIATREDLEGFVSFLVILKNHYRDNLEIPRTVIQLLHIYQPEQGLEEYIRLSKLLCFLLIDFPEDFVTFLISIIPPPEHVSRDIVKREVLKATAEIIMESQCDVVRSLIIFPGTEPADNFRFKENDLKKPISSTDKLENRIMEPIPIRIIAKTNQIELLPKRFKISTSGFSKIANITKIEKVRIEGSNLFEFFKTRNCLITISQNEEVGKTVKTDVRNGPKDADESKEENAAVDKKPDVDKPETVVITDVTDLCPTEYGCTLSEDDFNLIDFSKDEIGDDYFDDYGIDDFYALSTERNSTVRCNPTEVIIGSDVSLKDASVFPDDLKMYYFAKKTKAILDDKKISLGKNATNFSSILISKVLKSCDNSKQSLQ